MKRFWYGFTAGVLSFVVADFYVKPLAPEDVVYASIERISNGPQGLIIEAGGERFMIAEVDVSALREGCRYGLHVVRLRGSLPRVHTITHHP